MTLCHATGSSSNPYVQITVAAAGAYSGHYRQHADNGQGDIIPPFTYQGQTYSLNWNGTTQAIFDDDCERAGTPSTPSTPTTPSTPNTPGNPGNPGNPGGVGPVATTSSSKASTTAPVAAQVGPIPGAADAGSNLSTQWYLAGGLALAALGALAAGATFYRRKFLGR